MTFEEIAAGAVGILFLAAVAFGPMWLMWRSSWARDRGVTFFGYFGSFRLAIIGTMLLIPVLGLIVAIVKAILKA